MIVLSRADTSPQAMVGAALWEALVLPRRISRQNILCKMADQESAHPISPIN